MYGSPVDELASYYHRKTPGKKPGVSLLRQSWEDYVKSLTRDGDAVAN